MSTLTLLLIGIPVAFILWQTIYSSVVLTRNYRHLEKQLDEWLKNNSGVHVGLSEDGQRLVLVCISEAQAAIDTWAKLGHPPNPFFHHKLSLLFALLNDFPTLPPETTRPDYMSGLCMVS